MDVDGTEKKTLRTSARKAEKRKKEEKKNRIVKKQRVKTTNKMAFPKKRVAKGKK